MNLLKVQTVSIPHSFQCPSSLTNTGHEQTTAALAWISALLNQASLTQFFISPSNNRKQY